MVVISIRFVGMSLFFTVSPISTVIVNLGVYMNDGGTLHSIMITGASSALLSRDQGPFSGPGGMMMSPRVDTTVTVSSNSISPSARIFEKVD